MAKVSDSFFFKLRRKKRFNGMGKYMYTHNGTCSCISRSFYVEIYSNFQYVEGVAALNRLLEGTLRVLETWQETSGL